MMVLIVYFQIYIDINLVAIKLPVGTPSSPSENSRKEKQSSNYKENNTPIWTKIFSKRNH